MAIKMVLFDIDGVLTESKISVGKEYNYYKTLNYKDIDAVGLLRNFGLKLGIVTGEKDSFTAYVQEKFAPDYFFCGCKEKYKVIEEIALRENISLEDICYIGDGKYDIEAITKVGLGVCPVDAITEVIRCADYVVKRKGGEGCLAEVYTLLSDVNIMKNIKKESGTIVEKSLFEHTKLSQELMKDYILHNNIKKAVDVICDSFQVGGQLFFCGNGGSAADAQHLSTELVSKFYIERKALNAEALTVNSSTITAIANDYNYSRIFARQIEAKSKAGDILIGITTSGKSKNVIEAFKIAKEKKVTTIAFCGDNTEIIEKYSDIIIAIPSNDTPRIQEMHITIGHIICECIERRLFEN